MSTKALIYDLFTNITQIDNDQYELHSQSLKYVWIQGIITNISTIIDENNNCIKSYVIDDGTASISVRTQFDKIFTNGKYVLLTIGDYVLVSGLLTLAVLYENNKVVPKFLEIHTISLIDDSNLEILWMLENIYRI